MGAFVVAKARAPIERVEVRRFGLPVSAQARVGAGVGEEPSRQRMQELAAERERVEVVAALQ